MPKGACTFERHIDIDDGVVPVSPYCSLPSQIDTWFKAWYKARRMCGYSGEQKRIVPSKETNYLNSLVRGVYAKRDLKAGEIINDNSVYLAIPLQKGQISCREMMSGMMMLKDCRMDAPVMIEMIDSPYAYDENLKKQILNKRDLIPGINPEKGSQVE